MPRRAITSKHLPARMHLKHGAYYHVSTCNPRKWTRLGADLGSALRAWADIEAQAIPSEQTVFRSIASMYLEREVSKLREKTRQDYAKHLRFLELVFGDMNLDKIRPSDVHQYLELRGKKSKVQANREKSVLSAMFNFARRLGLVDCQNPCAGIRGHTERARDRYVTDAEFQLLYDAAPWWIQDVLDLAVLTGQRPADLLKISLDHLQLDCLFVQQNKTGQKLRISLSGQLAQVVRRIVERERVGTQLLVNRKGWALTYNQFRFEFDKARALTKSDWQLRDLRAKAATDFGSLAQAQKLLGHRSRSTTEIYTRDRLGELVEPLDRGGDV